MAAVGVATPYSPVAHVLGLLPLPFAYWLALLAVLVGYVVLTQSVKMWLLKRRWI